MPDLGLIITIATTCIGSTWFIAKTIRDVEKSICDRLEAHEKEDMHIFAEHGRRLQTLELKVFGFTGAGKGAV